MNHLSTNVSCCLDKDQKTEKTKLKRKILGIAKGGTRKKTEKIQKKRWGESKKKSDWNKGYEEKDEYMEVNIKQN